MNEHKEMWLKCRECGGPLYVTGRYRKSNKIVIRYRRCASCGENFVYTERLAYAKKEKNSSLSSNAVKGDQTLIDFLD